MSDDARVVAAREHEEGALWEILEMTDGHRDEYVKGIVAEYAAAVRATERAQIEADTPALWGALRVLNDDLESRELQMFGKPGEEWIAVRREPLVVFFAALRPFMEREREAKE